MRHLVGRIAIVGMLVAIMAGIALPAGMAQTPEPATPEPPPSFEITLLGVTDYSTSTTATPEAGNGGNQLIHAMLNLQIDPGAPVPPLIGMRSVVIHVQQGSLLVTATDGKVSVDVGTGEPILSGDDQGVLCERRSCALESGQAVILGPGNGISASQATVQMEIQGEEAAVVQVSVLLSGSLLSERCWICPTITP